MKDHSDPITFIHFDLLMNPMVITMLLNIIMMIIVIVERRPAWWPYPILTIGTHGSGQMIHPLPTGSPNPEFLVHLF